MLRRKRPDGALVRDLPRLRRMLLHVIRRRNDAVVHYEQRLDLSATEDYLTRWNALPERMPLRLFHVLMAALARTLQDRPHMNRFVLGSRLWQRNEVALSWSVVKERNDSGMMSSIKRTVGADAGLSAIAATLEGANGRARDKRGITRVEREVAFLTGLPGPLTRLLVRAEALVDRWNLLPRELIAVDPLHASAMVSNLGSIGIDACWHHLFENGTVSIFLTIGRAEPMPFVRADGNLEVRRGVLLRFTFDERVADGLYAARSLAHFQELAEAPWLLESSDDNGPGAPVLRDGADDPIRHPDDATRSGA